MFSPYYDIDAAFAMPYGASDFHATPCRLRCCHIVRHHTMPLNTTEDVNG